MFKRKKKISESEAYDSLLLPFVVDSLDDVVIDSGEEGSSQELLIKFNYSAETKSKIRFTAIVKDTYAICNEDIPFIHKMDNKEKEEYALVLKTFLEFAKSIYIMTTTDGKSVEYIVHSEFNNGDIYELSFFDSDMYPSVVNYIVNNASTGIYKNALKGK